MKTKTMRAKKAPKRIRLKRTDFPIGAFVIAGPEVGIQHPHGLGVLISAAVECGVKFVHLHAPVGDELCDEVADRVAAFAKRHKLKITAIAVGFADDEYNSIQRVRETVGFGIDDPEKLQQRYDQTIRIGHFAVRAGVTRLNGHAGHIPEADEPGFEKQLQFFARLFKDLADLGITEMAFESGPERAVTLATFIAALRERVQSFFTVGINFDPANIVLYGNGSPIEYFNKVATYVLSVHIKAAVPTTGTPGVDWGTEVPLRKASFSFPELLNAFAQAGLECPLVVEREILGETADQKRTRMFRDMPLLRKWRKDIGRS